MANSNNTQLFGSGTDSAKRAANDAAYGALLGAVIGATPTGRSQQTNANSGGMYQGQNVGGNLGNSQYTNANSGNVFQDPNAGGTSGNSTDLTGVAKDVING